MHPFSTRPRENCFRLPLAVGAGPELETHYRMRRYSGPIRFLDHETM